MKKRMTAFGTGSACVVLKAKICFAQVGILAYICDVAKDATPNGVVDYKSLVVSRKSKTNNCKLSIVN
ncbi:MAG: hypothetical protein LBC68_01210 [Prevotellaceae bacterium]|nr:hypothetical protein [Prevotellaceae bacterium]